MENKEISDPGLLILAGVMLVLASVLMIAFVFYIRKTRSRSNEITATHKMLLNAINQVADIEREMIAKNLHDEVGSTLNVIKLNLTKVQRNINAPELSLLLNESIEQLSESINNVRNISNDLKSPTLTKLGFEKGVAELCRKINSSEQIKINFDPSSKIIRLPDISELHLYRITQEVINNIIKHANAQTITISISTENDIMKIVIAHDGIGITNGTVNQLSGTIGGIGLKNIEIRAEQIGASVLYHSTENDGSKIIIELPCNEK